MSGLGKLRILDGDQVGFHCPGCEEMHTVTVAPGPNPWGFNGDFDAPTFTPSILVHGVKPMTEEQYTKVMGGTAVEPTPFVCHSLVTDGNIQFLGDCTHALAGSTVPLPPG